VIIESFDFGKILPLARTRQAVIAELGIAMQSYQRSNAEFDDEVGRLLDLNPTDLRCLDWLTGGRMSAGELSRATGLSSAATTSMIDRLERKGFVRRIREADDRRQVLVEMTEDGSARLWRLYGPLVEEGARLFERFTRAELETMLDLIHKMQTVAVEHREALRDIVPTNPVSGGADGI
jgi:DNA-binding MarR family transcriptional regulator